MDYEYYYCGTVFYSGETLEKKFYLDFGRDTTAPEFCQPMLGASMK